MAAAARHLASVTLELGGKCPAIIDGTTDLDAAVAYVAAGKTYNSGQVCLSPDYVLIRSDLRDAFVDRYMGWIKTHLYSDGTFNSSATSAMVDVRNQARVMSYVDEAVQKAPRCGDGAAPMRTRGRSSRSSYSTSRATRPSSARRSSAPSFRSSPGTTLRA